MAKNFHYFKFIATEWLTGDIFFEDYELQGIFITACSIYWHRDGKITFDELQKRIKSERLAELTDRFLYVKNGNILIKFLDEQLREAFHISVQNSENGKKGGRPKAAPALQKKPTALFSESETKAKKSQIEIEIELKENKVEINKYPRPRFFLKQQNEIEFEQIEMKSCLKDFEECLEQWSLSVEGSDFAYSENQTEDYRKLKARFEKWINSWRTNKAEKDKPKPEKIPESVRLGKAKLVEINGQMFVKPLNWHQ